MPKQEVHLDEVDQLYFQNQLTKINSKVFEKKYPALKARDFLPVENEERPGVTRLEYKIYDEKGMAKIAANYADDAPRVDFIAKTMYAEVKHLIDAYGYSVFDIQAARVAGIDLDARKATIARRKMLVLENKLAWFGDENYNIPGLLNHENIPTGIVPADGQGGLTTFASKVLDPEKILRDITELLLSIPSTTNEVHSPNALLLPTIQMGLVSTLRLTNTGVTLLSILKESFPNLKVIASLPELKDPFGDGDMMVAGEMDKENLQLEIIQEFNALPPQPRNFEQVINCFSDFAGVRVFRPLAFATRYGI